MKTKFQLELSQLTYEITAIMSTIECLVNLTQHLKSDEEVQEICIRLQECSKKLDNKITQSIINFSNGKFQFEFSLC